MSGWADKEKEEVGERTLTKSDDQFLEAALQEEGGKD